MPGSLAPRSWARRGPQLSPRRSWGGGLALAGTPKALRNCCLPSWDSHRQRLGDFRLVQGAGAPDWALQAGDLGRVLLTAQAGGPGGEVRQTPVGLKGPQATTSGMEPSHSPAGSVLFLGLDTHPFLDYRPHLFIFLYD